MVKKRTADANQFFAKRKLKLHRTYRSYLLTNSPQKDIKVKTGF
jgi:hypothetical protein